MDFVLGSKSPRRKQILETFNLPFRQIASDYDEAICNKNQPSKNYVLDLAEKKAKHFNNLDLKSILLTADTIVSYDNQILEKPKNTQENFTMLRTLSGKTHIVYTALCLKTEKSTKTRVQKTLVTFHELSDHNIHQYIKIFQPYDKAGGYSIQDGCSLLVKNLQGCYFNVLGMPITLLKDMLSEIRVDLWDYLKAY